MAGPVVFRWLKEKGGVDDGEMLRTFNCGIGMIVCVAPEDEANARAVLTAAGETVYGIGEIATAEGLPRVKYV